MNSAGLNPARCGKCALTPLVRKRKGGDVGRKTAGGAAIGGTSAVAWEMVRDNSHDVGNRALAGAAAGVVRGGLQMTETSPLFKRFVNKCLSEKNYSVIGWQ